MKKLGFGLMRLPLLDQNDDGSIDLELMKRMVDLFLERGFTYFDTAWMYCGGKSEEAVREALVSRHPRDSFTLTTKLPSYMLKSEEDREKVFSEQLRRTGAGYFDYYWLHDVNEESLRTFDRLHCWDFIREKKEAGLVRHIGFSYHAGPELLDRLLTEHPDTEFVQLQLNYADWENPDVCSRGCYEVARKHGKSIVVMEPVKGGTLANPPQQVADVLKAAEPDMSAASWAIRYVASLDGILTVLSGMSTVEQMEDNLSYMRDFKPLDAKEMAVIGKAQEELAKIEQIPCTACRYCTEGCPMNIPIPDIFAARNLQTLWGQEARARKEYANETKDKGKASDCIACGQCEMACPQQIKVTERLRECAANLE